MNATHRRARSESVRVLSLRAGLALGVMVLASCAPKPKTNWVTGNQRPAPTRGTYAAGATPTSAPAPAGTPTPTAAAPAPTASTPSAPLAEATDAKPAIKPIDSGVKPAGAPPKAVVAAKESVVKTPPTPAAATPSKDAKDAGAKREAAVGLVDDGAEAPKPAPRVESKPAAPVSPAPQNPAPSKPTPERPVAPAGGSAARETPAPTEPAKPPFDPAAKAGLPLIDRAIDQILASSTSEDGQLRANAVEAASYAPRALEPVLVKGLEDTLPGVRAVAAMAISKQKLCTLASRVEPMVNDASPYVRVAAILVVARCQSLDQRVQPLADMLRSEDAKLRAHAAFVLGEIGERSALPMIKAEARRPMPTLGASEFTIMQLNFAEAMFKLGDAGQIETIRAALFPSQPDELEAAALAAQIIGELKDRRPMDQLVYMSVYKDASGQMYPGEIRMAIASALGKMGLDRGGFIADEYAKDVNPALRAQAASVYGDTGRAEHLAKLEPMLTDPEERVRLAAAAAVVKIQGRGGQLPSVGTGRGLPTK